MRLKIVHIIVIDLLYLKKNSLLMLFMSNTIIELED